ncbi:hypothetical protein [Haloechinothrix halophila]|uniref:hypothetical protein n=1 Tax=Haloechinothrix halophila TaxID=1069073 RepID=UPI00146FAA8C|nr:hypothetical protein [Haloechinothrix halophila]
MTVVLDLLLDHVDHHPADVALSVFAMPHGVIETEVPEDPITALGVGNALSSPPLFTARHTDPSPRSWHTVDLLCSLNDQQNRTIGTNFGH